MIQRGFPQDLPVRPAHALQLDWRVTQRNLIPIWLPEGVSADGRWVWFLLREPPPLHWTVGGEAECEGRFELNDRCRVVARTAPRDDGIDLHLQVTNLTPAAWSTVRLTVCVQLAAAPDFRDPGLERTWYHTRGGWRKFDPQKTNRSYPGGCHFYGTDYQPDKSDVDRFEIRVASPCGRWFFSHCFPQATAVAGNCHESFCCVHSDPVFGPVAPGATGEARGWIRVRNESVDVPPLGE